MLFGNSRNPRFERYLLMADPPGGGGGGNPPADPPPADPPAPGTGDPPPVDAPPSAGDWFEGLPDDLKGDDVVATYKGKPVSEVLTSVRDLSKKVAEYAPPATPKDYGIALPASLAEVANEPGAPELLNAELNRVLTEAHADGMSKAQAQARVDREAKTFLSDLAASKKANAEALKELKEEWGDKYPERETYVARAIETFPEKTKKIVTESKLNNDPFFIRLVYTIGEAQREGRAHHGDPGSGELSLADALYKK